MKQVRIPSYIGYLVTRTKFIIYNSTFIIYFSFLLFTLLFIFAQNKNMRNIIISVNLFILVLVLSQTS